MKWPWQRSTEQPQVERAGERKAEEPPPEIKQRFEEIARYEEAVKIYQARLRTLKEGQT